MKLRMIKDHFSLKTHVSNSLDNYIAKILHIHYPRISFQSERYVCIDLVHGKICGTVTVSRGRGHSDLTGGGTSRNGGSDLGGRDDGEAGCRRAAEAHCRGAGKTRAGDRDHRADRTTRGRKARNGGGRDNGEVTTAVTVSRGRGHSDLTGGGTSRNGGGDLGGRHDGEAGCRRAAEAHCRGAGKIRAGDGDHRADRTTRGRKARNGGGRDNGEVTTAVTVSRRRGHSDLTGGGTSRNGGGDLGGRHDGEAGCRRAAEAHCRGAGKIRAGDRDHRADRTTRRRKARNGGGRDNR